MIDLADGNTGVLDHLLEQHQRHQQILVDALELGAGQLLVEEQRVLVRVDGDVAQVDRRALTGTQFDLGLLSGFTEPLDGRLVLWSGRAEDRLELDEQHRRSG